MSKQRSLQIFCVLLVSDVSRVFSGVIRAPISIDSCERMIEVEGEFRLGSVRPSPLQYPAYCSLKIRSPLNTKIKLSFKPLSDYRCEALENFLVVVNGWQITNKLGRRNDFIPETEDPEQRRQLVCPNDNSAPVTLDQNYAELAYILEEHVVVVVEFVAHENGCNQLLSINDEGKDLVLRNDKAAACKWYLPGNIQISILQHQLGEDSNECGENAENSVRIYAGQSLHNLLLWDTVCPNTAVPIRATIPCPYSALELVSRRKRGLPQAVSFTFEPISSPEQLLFNYHKCY